MNNSAQDVTKALGGRWRRDYGTAKCPCHEDRNPSLTLRDGERTVLFTCHAGCRSADIAAALKADGILPGADLGDARPTPRSRNSDIQPEPEPDRAARVAKAAMAIWATAKPADTSHPYLLRKRLPALGDVRQRGDALVVPMQQPAVMTGLQFIGPSGGKRFLRGTILNGSYTILGDPSLHRSRLLICEGWATGCALHLATGADVAIAFTAGNLKAVATRLRRFFAHEPFVICADDDDAGLKGAEAAADAVGGAVARAS